MLTNKKYAGDVRIAKPQGNRKGNIAVTGGYLLTDAHPSIIQRDVFADVQAERKRRSNVVSDELGTHRKATRYSVNFLRVVLPASRAFILRSRLWKDKTLALTSRAYTKS